MKNNNILTIPLLLSLIYFTIPAANVNSAQPHSPSRHHHSSTSHENHTFYAPIGEMGNHIHKTGEVMFSYRYMLMAMDGNRDGTKGLSNSEVLEDFMVTPTDMEMHMHMFGFMYAPTDYLTLMAMFPYIKKSMNHLTRTGVEFETASQGFGDLRTTALIKINDYFLLNLGFSFPTGSIDEKDNTPAANNVVLPYPMQLGSGTFNLHPGITYLGNKNIISWGSKIVGTIRVGENDRNYALGDRVDINGWTTVKLNDWLSVLAALDWKGWKNIDGADSSLNSNAIPTADPNRRAGQRLDGSLGLNIINQLGPELIKGQALGIQVGLPLYQKLDGPQLETDWILTLGWQYVLKLY